MGSEINKISSKNLDKEESMITHTNINLIKSKVIIRKVFSYLNTRKILDFIKYNNKLKNIFGYNIDDYKKLCNRYIIINRNGKGTEYLMNSKIILFEGIFKNGKRNGKGKEYYHNRSLKFEGVYYNGNKIYGKGYDIYNNKILEIEKNGQGKEYFDNGNLQFKGEYKNGRKWIGKGYNKEGNEKFEIKNGNGKVKEYYYNGKLKYEGEY